MKPSNPFWQPITRALHWSKVKSIIVLLMIAVAFPALENMLNSWWTSATPATSKPLFLTLLVVIGLHAVFTLIAVIEQLQGRCERILPKAFELEEDSEKLTAELKRRETTNKLVRSAFDQLNAQRCQIEFYPDSDAWCLKGFWNGLMPILAPFIDNIDSTLGVRGHKFSIEVYFTQGTVPIRGCRNDCHRNLSQLAFFSPHVHNCTAVRMPTNCSPAQIGFDAGTAFEQHID
jgi:hypothetical protein